MTWTQIVIDFLLNYAVFIGLFLVGWIFGRLNERDHWQSLTADEATLGHIIISSERFYRPNLPAEAQGTLVVGSVVVGQDYFKMIIAGILNFFGKNLTTYESLLDRARREAIVRMKREAQFLGCNQVYGIRLEVTTLDPMGKMVEAIAYGTAVHTVGNTKIPPPLPTSS